MTLVQAHVIAPQYSIFDNGALHAIADLRLAIPLIALGLALGRGERWPASVAGLCGLIAFMAGVQLWNQPANPLAGYGVAVGFLAAGASLMAGERGGYISAVAAAVLVGLITGGLGRQEDASAPLPGWFTVGLATGSGLLVFFAAWAAARYRPAWTRILVRILASWLLAIGFMFGGLALRPPVAPAIDPAAGPSVADVSPCPGAHRHAPDGEIVCVPVPPPEKPGTPSPHVRASGGVPDATQPGPAKHRTAASP